MPNFDDCFSKCKSLFDSKEFLKVIDCCDNLLYNGFDDELILNYKASAFMQLREYKNAIECYDLLLKINKCEYGYWFNKSQAWKLYGYYNDADKVLFEALEFFNNILNSNPNNFSYFDSKIRILVDLEMYGDALDLIEVQLIDNVNDSRLWYLKSLIFKEWRKYDDALESIVMALKLDNDNHQYHYLKSIILKEMKNYDDALKSINIALTLNSDNFNYLAIKGEILRELSEFDDAIVCYKNALDLHPFDDSIKWYIYFCYKLKSRALYTQGNYEEALGNFDIYLENTPVSYDEWGDRRYKGKLLEKVNRFDDAMKIYDNAFEYKLLCLEHKAEYLFNNQHIKESFDCYNLLLDTYFNYKNSKDWENMWYEKFLNECITKYDSNDFFKHIFEIDLVNRDCWIEKIKFSYKLDEHEKAIQCCDELLKLKMDDVEVLFLKSKIYGWIRDYDNCLTYINEALRFDSQNEDLIKYKYNISISNENWDDALEIYKSYNEIIQFDKSNLENLAEGLLTSGNYGDSYLIYEKIFKKQPLQATAEFYNNLNESWVKYSGGDYEKYLKYFDRGNLKKTVFNEVVTCPNCGHELDDEDYGCIIGDFDIIKSCKNCSSRFNKFDLYGINLKENEGMSLSQNKINQINIVSHELRYQESHDSLPLHLLEFYFEKRFEISSDDFNDILNLLKNNNIIFEPIEDYVKIYNDKYWENY